MISVALIEDNRLVRKGISALLNQVKDLRVVATGPSGDPALLQGVNPQVVLLDVGLQNGDSLRTAEKVKKEFPECKIIVMDLLPVPEEVMEFVDGGAAPPRPLSRLDAARPGDPSPCTPCRHRFRRTRRAR